MALDQKVLSEILKFKPDDIITLFDLDMSEIGGSIFRFTPNVGAENLLLQESGEEFLLADGVTPLAMENIEPFPVYWRSNAYYPIAATAQGFEMSSGGQLPRPTLTVSNALNTLRAEMIAYNNLSGATVTRWRTFAKHLDGGTDPDPDVYFPPDVYKVDRKVNDGPVSVEFELSTVIDQEGVFLPRRQILRNTCTHIYRVWDEDAEEFDYTKATCPYAGTDYFDENGNSVLLPEEDVPSKLLDSCCKKRFYRQALPTRAFPGVGRFR